MKNTRNKAIVFNLLHRNVGMFDDLGRNGGGLEPFRGGYAKCILARLRPPRIKEAVSN